MFSLKISVVVYCYNSGENLERFHVNLSNTLKLLKDDYEIIYINDGSEDDTLLALQVVANHSNHLKYISFTRHFGREGALCAGLEHSKGEVVVLMDGSFIHPPNVILEMMDEYKKGNNHVLASKKLENSVLKKAKKGIVEKFIRKFVDPDILQNESDFRLLSRKVVNAILSMPESNRYSKGMFNWIGFKIKEIEYEITSRIINKESEVKKLDSMKRSIEYILCFNTRPLRLLTKIGLLLIGISLLIFIMMSFKVLLVGIRIPGLYTISNFIMLFGGVQLLMIGVLGEYLGKTYYEAKRRPQYIVEASSYDKE
ncbi:glycosyltransferase family 2 protein [Bacillus sp. AFS017336]|uniref:glycosyltransferase family 2 protein n=1 Tax=Bacillus sp. AFS017336 TaxID=2033489 RepID=UPI000BEF69DA|nr:glycosyltransferase family 2 protein [Bacillus sp. AFS017336]PEL09383.1 glycosyltransferase [Bacillus sp. AFS017336]